MTDAFLPAFVDLTTSVRFPPTPDVEAPQTLALAARAGGFGFVVCAAVGEGHCPVAGTLESHEALARHLEDSTLVAASSPVRGHDLAEIASIARAPRRPVALRLTHTVGDTALLRRVLEMARAHDLVVIAPSMDAALSQGAVAVEGAIATRLGLAGVPEAAEAIEVNRLVELARLTRARIHVAQLFTAQGAVLVERARAEGLPVSGCVGITQLALDEGALLERPYDVALRCWPPLPSRAAREALRAAVARGAVCISSGHAPAPVREKDLEWAIATPGASTLPVTAPVAFAIFTDDEAVRALATEPARILGVHALAARARTDTAARGTVREGLLRGVATRGAFALESVPDGVVAQPRGGQ